MTFIEQGHVRVGPDTITDPAFLVTRHMEDFVTWVDTSKIKRTIARYNDEVRLRLRLRLLSRGIAGAVYIPSRHILPYTAHPPAHLDSFFHFLVHDLPICICKLHAHQSRFCPQLDDFDLL